MSRSPASVAALTTQGSKPAYPAAGTMLSLIEITSFWPGTDRAARRRSRRYDRPFMMSSALLLCEELPWCMWTSTC